MTASQIGIKGPEPGIVYVPYILATTTATISASDDFYNRIKRKDRHDKLNTLLDENDEIDFGISSRYSRVPMGTYSYLIHTI